MELLTEYISSVPAWLIYLIVFGSAFLENVFPPWPSDVLLAFTGFLAAHDGISTRMLILASVGGNMAGAVVMYYSGLRLLHWMKSKEEHSTHAVTHKILKFTSSAEMEKAGTWFHSYGLIFVAGSRFFPGVRFFVSIIAGASHFPVIRFLIAFFAGVLVWSYILVEGGYLLGDKWQLIADILETYGKITGGISAVLITGFVLWLFRKRWMKLFRKQP